MRRLLGALGAAVLSLGVAVPVVRAANTLSDPSISPPSGTTETDFTFSVRYDSDQGRVPNEVHVTIGGVGDFELARVSGTAAHGTYAITLQLPAGTRVVTFAASVSQGPNPWISAGSVVVTEAPPTPAPTPTPMPTATPMPTPNATPMPTSSPTATPAPAATPLVTVRPTAVPATTAPSPTTSEGVLPGTPPPSAAPSATVAATTAPVAAVVSPRPAASSTAEPAAAEEAARPMPAGMIWMLVGGTISMSGAGMLAILAVRRQRARP